MKWSLFFAGLFNAIVASAPVMAEDEMPRECVAMAMLIGTETRSQYVRKSSVMVFFKPPLQTTTLLENELSIGCQPWLSDRKDWSVHVYWGQSPSPPKEYYEIISKSGRILTGENEPALTSAAKVCVKKALSNTSDLGDELTDKAKLECQAFVRDGGSVSGVTTCKR